MGAVEDALDAAANFVAPLLEKGSKQPGLPPSGGNTKEVLDKALAHLQAINDAESAADPSAPYDGSLVGVVYGLLDVIWAVGIRPHLSPGVAFGQRPQSVLHPSLSFQCPREPESLLHTLQTLIIVLRQDRTGVQPLVSQRILPDIVAALAELAFSPSTRQKVQEIHQPLFYQILAETPTSRLLPLLTTFLQQDIPPWQREKFAKELTIIPLRAHGVRHTIEFLSLSYLSKNSKVPVDASGSQVQIPLPLEAITQASRLLVSVPTGMRQEDWFTQLAPQLWSLLDGTEGKELSRATGQIISGGILNRKSTGAPGTAGWELFARPLLENIKPMDVEAVNSTQSSAKRVIVDEHHLKLSLKRLTTLVLSYSHKGLIKRLVTPVLLPLWGLYIYAQSRPSLDKEWSEISRIILLQYLKTACEPDKVDTLASNLHWNGDVSWIFGPGSQGGIELRRRPPEADDIACMEDVLSRLGTLDARVNLLVSLLADANIEDHIAGAIFVRMTEKWLSPSDLTKPSLTQEPDVDPLTLVSYAKLSEAMGQRFKGSFARSPRHIIELMVQLLQSFVSEYKARSTNDLSKPSRANFSRLPRVTQGASSAGEDKESEDLIFFALSILSTLAASPDFKRTPETTLLFKSIRPSLQYLSQQTDTAYISPLIANAATNLLQALNPTPESITATDPLAPHRATLKTVLTDITSPEPPNRTWALTTLRKLIQDPATFPLIDIPSTTHMLLSASIADPESYVHLAAMPVLVDLAVRAPHPTLRILVDAFVDVDERSLRLKKEKEIEQALDFRLRVGEVLNNIVLEDRFWVADASVSGRYPRLKSIVEATLSLASRRGQRKQTLAKRNKMADAERQRQEEGEAAWGGPIPNLLDPDSENLAEQAERDALLKILQGWEETGVEEDVRIRTSALSILSSLVEKRLRLASHVTVDAALQMVILIVTVETGETKAILRRAAVLVVMGLLRGLDAALEESEQTGPGLGIKQTEDIERVMQWVKDEDMDGLVRDHAGNVIDGLVAWRMKKLYKIWNEDLRLGPDLELEGNLRGLHVNPVTDGSRTTRQRPVVEEIE